jgi:glycosyltransferase involved in cell wall biosynthesis
MPEGTPNGRESSGIEAPARFRVAIVYRTLPHYRRSFFIILRRLLAADGIDLLLIHGAPYGLSLAKQDWAEIPGALVIENRILHLGRRQLVWQPCLRALRGCDLIVAEQASRLLTNYLFHAWSLLGFRKFALWGHGRNMQRHDANPLAEFAKRRLLRCCDWWFAYTDETRAFLAARGVAASRVTSVQNAVNERSLVAAAERVSLERIEEARRRLGFNGENVALFIGSLYREKRLSFLIEACKTIREVVPDFELAVVGAGPEEAMIRQACAQLPFLRLAGVATEHEKIVYFRMSKLLLMPGLVGLASAEAINFGVPLVTVQLPYHSPEIAYVKHGVNGVVLPEETTPREYGLTVARYLTDETARARLRQGCLEERYRYTTDAMAQRFAHGVKQCLGMENAASAQIDETALAPSL